MKQKVLHLTLLLFLVGCGATSSSIASSSASEIASSSTSEISSSSSFIESSELSSEDATSSMDNTMGNLSDKWATLLSLNASLFTENEISLTPLMVDTDVVEAVAIYHLEDATLYGYAYEANVSGNGGRIRFQIAIVEGAFAAFKAVSHNEHLSFGVKIINAFNFNLPGEPATLEAAIAVLIAANTGRSGISETYDGMIPAIEAMVLHAANA